MNTEQSAAVNTLSAEEKFAKLISRFFHPLLIPTYGFLLIFFTQNYISTFTSSALKIIVLSITFVFTFLLPAVNAYVLLKMGRIKSLEMEDSRDRAMPYMNTAICYFSLYYLFYNAAFPNVFRLLILGAGVSIILTWLINFKWKISAHTIAIGGMAGATLGMMYRLKIDLQFVLLLTLFVSGLVAYSRLKLKAHEPSQVYAGFCLGFFVELLLMILY